MNRLFLPNFDLHATLLGGQSFSWDLNGDLYTGFTSSRYIELKREGDYLLWQTYPIKDDITYITNYLRLDVDYEDILSRFPIDNHLDIAKHKFVGLRLLSQDFPDTLLGYICSSNKSIKAIRSSIRKLRDIYGEEIIVNGNKVKLFPKLESLHTLGLETLLSTGVGFRGKYLMEASKAYSQGLFDGVDTLKYWEAKQKLISLNGVGDKVADCVLLYSLKHDEVIPLDIWVRRVVERYYGLSSNMKYEKVQEWIKGYFNGVGGWAGQMLFEYIRGFI